MARVLVANSEVFRPASVPSGMEADNQLADRAQARAGEKLTPALRLLQLAEGLATSKAVGAGVGGIMRLGRFISDTADDANDPALRAQAAEALVAPKPTLAPEMAAARAGDPAGPLAAPSPVDPDEQMAMAMMDDRFKRIQKGTYGTDIEDYDTPADKMMDFRGVRPLSAEPARKLDASETAQAQEVRDRLQGMARKEAGLAPKITATDRALAEDGSAYGAMRFASARGETLPDTPGLEAAPPAPAPPEGATAPAPPEGAKWPTRPVTNPTQLLLLARQATTQAKRDQIMDWAADADVYGESLADYATGGHKLRFAKQLSDAMPKLVAEDDLRAANIRSQIGTREGQLTLGQVKRQDALDKLVIQQAQHKDRMDGLYANIRAANGRQAKAIEAQKAADAFKAYQAELDRQAAAVAGAIEGAAAASEPVSTKAYDATAQLVADAKARVESAKIMKAEQDKRAKDGYVPEEEVKAQAAEERAAAAGLARAQERRVSELANLEKARAANRGKAAKGGGVGVDPSRPNLPDLPTLLAIQEQIRKDKAESLKAFRDGPKAPKPRKKGK